MAAIRRGVPVAIMVGRVSRAAKLLAGQIAYLAPIRRRAMANGQF